jgi:hypothetical protein
MILLYKVSLSMSDMNPSSNYLSAQSSSIYSSVQIDEDVRKSYGNLRGNENDDCQNVSVVWGHTLD